MTTEPKLNELHAAILGVLARGPDYGLGIHDALVRRGAVEAEAAPAGYLYPELRDMERLGWLSSYEGPPVPERGNRPRRFYVLTEEGRRARLFLVAASLKHR